MIGRVAPLLLVGLAASPAWSQQAEQRAEVPPAAARAAAPLFTPDQLMFLSHMIVHHEQALEMAAMVPSRSRREDFIRYARYLDGAQRVEIDQMKGLLREARERGLEIPRHEMTGDPPMSGMLSRAQMAALAAANGAEFEKLWLLGMIYHHEGGLAMAREQQEQQFENGRQTYGIDVLVDDIIEVQRAEVAKMKGWLTQWGEPAAPRE
jgi:uncharacterized protein (DUF305 family)